MAKIPKKTKNTILYLIGQFAELIDEAAATESTIGEQFGETEETMPTLEQLENARERLRDPYSRLCTLFLRIAESQPTASCYAKFTGSDHRRRASKRRCKEASIREAKGDFDLL